MYKKQLLLKRGFKEEDIENNFANYNGRWEINTLTKEQVISAKTPKDLGPLFYKDSVNTSGICAVHIGASFDYFANASDEFNIAPSQLDSHIARLCAAVNSIGINTCMSCDGWHKDKESFSFMKLYMKERYSVIWFWLITEYIFGEKWSNNGSWNNIWEPFDRDYTQQPADMLMCRYSIADKSEADQVFDKNNSYAEFIEKHTQEFLELKKHITDSIYKAMADDEIKNIERLGFLEVRRQMYKAFIQYANPLIMVFSQKYPYIVQNNKSLHNM